MSCYQRRYYQASLSSTVACAVPSGPLTGDNCTEVCRREGQTQSISSTSAWLLRLWMPQTFFPSFVLQHSRFTARLLSKCGIYICSAPKKGKGLLCSLLCTHLGNVPGSKLLEIASLSRNECIQEVCNLNEKVCGAYSEKGSLNVSVAINKLWNININLG